MTNVVFSLSCQCLELQLKAKSLEETKIIWCNRLFLKLIIESLTIIQVPGLSMKNFYNKKSRTYSRKMDLFTQNPALNPAQNLKAIVASSKQLQELGYFKKLEMTQDMINSAMIDVATMKEHAKNLHNNTGDVDSKRLVELLQATIRNCGEALDPKNVITPASAIFALAKTVNDLSKRALWLYENSKFKSSI